MLNKYMCIGRLTADPELRTVGQNGDEVVSFTIATSEKYKTKQGEKKETTEFVNVQFWRAQASVINQYCKKGMLLYIEGKMKTDKYDKEGQTHYSTKIVGSQFQFLESKKDQGQGGFQNQNQNQNFNNQQNNQNGQNNQSDFMNPDEIPF